MRAKFIISFVILSYTSVLSATSVQNNPFCAQNGVAVSFQLQSSNSYNISPGQQFEGIQSDGNCFNVRAGRHGSSSNISWIKEQDNGVFGNNWNGYKVVTNNNVYNNKTPYNYGVPNALNFAIYGTLTIKYNNVTYNCPNVIIAQGHNIAGNDWWIFDNPSADTRGWDNSLYCTDSLSGGAYQVYYWGPVLSSNAILNQN